MAGHRFLSAHRIRSSRDFQQAYGRRSTASDALLLVFGHENGLTHPRLGLSVSRKLGGAVVRNRLKRMIREAFRLTLDRLPNGLDLVVVPRQSELPDLAQVRASLARLAERVAQRLVKRP